MRSIAFPITTVSFGVLVSCGAPQGQERPAVPVVVVDAGAASAPEAVVPLRDPMCGQRKLGFSDPKKTPPGPDDDVETNTVATPSDPKRTCEMADANIGAAEKAVLASPHGAKPLGPAPWDHKSRPAYLEQVERRFHLTVAERAMLEKQGFVVSPRHSFSNYSWAFHELYQSEIPLYVSSDAIFHAIYASNDKLIEAIETKRLAPLLEQLLSALHCALADAATSYPRDVARDIDLYLTVARSLLADGAVTSVLGSSEEAEKLVALAKKPGGMERLTLFGRARYVDFSAYTPRGHYAKELAPYFRSVMWLSRLEFNLVSRSSRSSHPENLPDPTETPREATVALALSDLVERASAMAAVDLFDRAFGLLAGKREDISLQELAKLRKKANIHAITVESAPALRAAIGNDYQRRARLHYMPEGAAVLPAIATFIGPRVVPDTTATRPLVHDEVGDRFMLQGTDMAYALGHDRAKLYVASELAKYASLGKGLERARAIAHEPLPEGDLYAAWFGAVRSLAEKPEGVLPSFMATPAFEDLRVNGAIAAFGQLRHNYVLIAGQGYGAAGCEIPDGYVDPVPHVYSALIAYMERGAKVMAELDPEDTLHARGYFARGRAVLEVLRAIARDELAGRPLSVEEKRFLSMVAEYLPPGTGSASKYTGWYFDLFRDRTEEGLTEADFVADYYTSGYTKEIAYVGAMAPRLGFFVVDTGGAPRVVVGPVARAYEYTGPLAERLTDESARAVSGKREPWAASYTASAAAPPKIAVRQRYDDGGEGKPKPLVVEVKSDKALGPVTLSLLDHHRVPFTQLTKPVRAGITEFRFATRKPPASAGTPNIEGAYLKIGAFEYVHTVEVGAMGADSIHFELGGAAFVDGE